MTDKLAAAISNFGAEAKAKPSNPSATGEPEDQLRAPLEGLFAELAELCGFKRAWVAAVGESSISNLKVQTGCATNPRDLLTGLVEVKSSDNGTDPRRNLVIVAKQVIPPQKGE